MAGLGRLEHTGSGMDISVSESSSAFARPEVADRFPGRWSGRALRLALGPLGREQASGAREALGSTPFYQDAVRPLIRAAVNT